MRKNDKYYKKRSEQAKKCRDALSHVKKSPEEQLSMNLKAAAWHDLSRCLFDSSHTRGITLVSVQSLFRPFQPHHSSHPHLHIRFKLLPC